MEIDYGPLPSRPPDYSSSRPNLKYRRQFAAAFMQSDRFPDWQHCELPEFGLHVYIHPDLEITMAFAGGKGIRLILLGYAIDVRGKSEKIMVKKIIWILVSLIAGSSLAVVTGIINPSEKVNALWLVVAAGCFYMITYRFYASFLAAKVLVLNEERTTPAKRLYTASTITHQTGGFFSVTTLRQYQEQAH